MGPGRRRAVLLVTLLAAGFVVGLSPLLLGLGREIGGRPQLLAIAAVAGLGLSGWALRHEPSQDRPKRTWHEHALAAVNSTIYSSGMAFSGFVLFLVVFGAVRLGGGWFGWTIRDVTAGYYTSLIFTASLAVGMWPNAVRLVMGYLYPVEDPSTSVYATSVERAQLRRTPVLLTLAVLIVATAIVEEGFGLIPNVFWFMLIVSAGSLATPQTSDLRRLDEERFHHVVEQTARAFESAGFGCVRYPTTGDAAVDPLLENVHLLVSRGDCVYAVEVNVAYKRFDIEWTDLTALVLASSNLSTYLRDVQSVDPVFIVWHGRPDDDIRGFAKRFDITLIGVDRSGQTYFTPATPCGGELTSAVERLAVVASEIDTVEVPA